MLARLYPDLSALDPQIVPLVRVITAIGLPPVYACAGHVEERRGIMQYAYPVSFCHWKRMMRDKRSVSSGSSRCLGFSITAVTASLMWRGCWIGWRTSSLATSGLSGQRVPAVH